jgi:hypothetical protein
VLLIRRLKMEVNEIFFRPTHQELGKNNLIQLVKMKNVIILAPADMK